MEIYTLLYYEYDTRNGSSVQIKHVCADMSDAREKAENLRSEWIARVLGECGIPSEEEAEKRNVTVTKETYEERDKVAYSVAISPGFIEESKFVGAIRHGVRAMTAEIQKWNIQAE